MQTRSGIHGRAEGGPAHLILDVQIGAAGNEKLRRLFTRAFAGPVERSASELGKVRAATSRGMFSGSVA